MKLVSCVGWVPKGRAAANPHKVKLNDDELRALLQPGEGVLESSDIGGTSDGEDQPTTNGETSAAPKKGLRGSAVEDAIAETPDVEKKKTKKAKKRKAEESEAAPAEPTEDNEDDTEEGSSDSESEQHAQATALTGVAMFASAMDDPYLQDHKDSSDDDDDFRVADSDNLVVAGKIIKSEYNLVVYVYNAGAQDLYVHHDYLLETPPLCLTTIGFDPDGSKNHAGNLCAVGSMSEQIQIWDLDIVNGVEPIAVFGAPDKPKKKKKKRLAGAEGGAPKQPSGHSDSVICLAWNAQMEHVLASGSADHTVILWDIERAQAANVFKHHTDKVQSLAWHPEEDATLLSGGCDGQLAIVDCGGMEVSHKWQLKEDEEIECAIWHPTKSDYCLVSTDAGSIHTFDRRCNGKILHSIEEAHHSGAASSLAAHKQWPTLLVSTGEGDEIVKVWQFDPTKAASSDALEMIYAHQPNLGNVHNVSFCPDSARPCIALSGTAGDYLSVLSLHSLPTVQDHFNF